MIAHEFSHILNGDMRLNLRLIGVLYGILLIVVLAGLLLLELGGTQPSGEPQQRQRRSRAALFAVGLALWVLGYIGVFFGRLIKAACRASASSWPTPRGAVHAQSGRHRRCAAQDRRSYRADGLGSRIDHPQAESLSHLFLGAARPSFVRGIFATHPPMDERLRRIYGRAVGSMPAPENAVALALGGLEPSPEPARPRSPIQFVPTGSTVAAAAQFAALPERTSPVAGLMRADSAAAASVTADIGTVRPPRQSRLCARRRAAGAH